MGATARLAPPPAGRGNLGPRRAQFVKQAMGFVKRGNVVLEVGPQQTLDDVAIERGQTLGEFAANVDIKAGEQAVVDDIDGARNGSACVMLRRLISAR